MCFYRIVYFHIMKVKPDTNKIRAIARQSVSDDYQACIWTCTIWDYMFREQAKIQLSKNSHWIAIKRFKSCSRRTGSVISLLGHQWIFNSIFIQNFDFLSEHRAIFVQKLAILFLVSGQRWLKGFIVRLPNTCVALTHWLHQCHGNLWI